MAKKSDAQQIADCVTEIEKARSGSNYNNYPIRVCIGKFRTIASNGSNLKKLYPTLINSIDAAILKFYPHNGYWDDGHRSQLLLGYIEILEKIVRTDPVEINGYERILGFCAAIRSGFENFTRSHT